MSFGNRSKRRIFPFLTVLLVSIFAPQVLGIQEVIVGTGTDESVSWMPFETYVHACRTEMIYLQSEIGVPGQISRIAFYVFQDWSDTGPLKSCTVRMKHTSLNAFSPTNYFDNSGLTTVLSTQTLPEVNAEGWYEILLTTPFSYNNTDHLMVDISIDLGTSYGDDYDECYWTSVSTVRALWQEDEDDSLGNPLVWSHCDNDETKIPNIKLWIDPPPCGPPSAVTAYANGSAGGATICAGDPVDLTEGSHTGGSCMSGNWEYCWYVGGSAQTSWSTSSAYTPSPAATTTYELRMRCSSCPETYVSDTVTVTVLTGPSITVQPSPSSRTICSGDSVIYCVQASGSAPLYYQWKKNDSPILGAASSCYTATEAGTYTCTVSNTCDSVTSSPAVLTICNVPVITTHPQSVTVREGDDAEFTTAASGCGPLSYQWYRDDVYAGSGPTFHLYDIPCEYDGTQIYCRISNDCGEVSTDSATVSIEYPIGDFNDDCGVDLADFAIFAQHWLAGVINP